MKDTHEIIEYSKNLAMKLFYQRIGHSPRHWHRSIEILFVLSGEMEVMVENNSYHLKEDAIILINPNQLHETHSPDCVLITLQLRLSMFGRDWLTPETVAFDCNSSLHQNKLPFLPLKKIIAKLVQINSVQSRNNELINYAYAYQLIHELYSNFRSDALISAGRSQKNLDRLRRILDYIEEHYKEDLSLTSMAEKEYLSPTYLSHFFQDNMGIPFSSYVTKFRLAHSIPDLQNTDLSLDEIAYRNGFVNARSFSKLFTKEYHKLPSTYRKENAGTGGISALHPTDTINYLELEKYDHLDKLAVYLSDSSGRRESSPAPVSVYSLGTIPMAAPTIRLRHTFRQICSVGRAKEMLYEDIREMLRLQQREIGFHYIKFHGVLDDELDVFSLDPSGKPNVNFFYLDQIFDFILSIELKPVVQLSFMPKALAKHPERTVFNHAFIISEPNNDAVWSWLITTLTKHFIERYGRKEVRSWIFTFWNETMNRFPFDFNTVDLFLHLYEITYLAVKEADSRLVFSSTSYVGFRYPFTNYEQFLEYAQEHDCSPDAYLFHFYPASTEHAEWLSKLSLEEYNQYHPNTRLTLDNSLDAFDQYIESIRKTLPSGNKKPVYITEWNFTPSHREWLNDTCFSSAYIVRNILANYDKLDSFCHWSLTDWIEEMVFSQELFHGGMGFFTRNGIKKPAYHAYHFLSRLESQFVAKGDGYFITKGDDRYVILLYYYVQISDLYAQGITFNTTFTERYHPFDHANDRMVDFVLSNITDGTYLITEHIVNRHHGSVFDKWLEMGGLELKKQEDIDTLRMLSAPMVHKKQVTVTDNLLPYSVTMEPLEIRLIEIEL